MYRLVRPNNYTSKKLGTKIKCYNIDNYFINIIINRSSFSFFCYVQPRGKVHIQKLHTALKTFLLTNVIFQVQFSFE